MGKSAKSAKMDVTEYRLSIHFGICAEADALTGIYVGEKPAWTGNVTAQGSIAINNSELFGGIKKEGGVGGNVYYLPGTATQQLPDGLASRLGGLTGANCPGFRGLASIFFTGEDPSAAPTFPGVGWPYAVPGYLNGRGFYWGANNPYLRSVWARVRRAPKGLNAAHRVVTTSPYTVNPAHIIYECLTNADWGMGAPSSIVDIPSFQDAGQTLYNEQFGLAMIWTRQMDIEGFIGEILDHIQATLFTNPRTGLLTLKLYRDDYDPDTLPELNPDNCTVTRFDRKAWGNTANEIVVTWTNPENEQDETVTAQDLANISVQGEVVSDSRNYYGVRTADLAMRLATRDLRTASAPLAAFEIEVDRTAWDVLPGECRRLVYPEHGIDGLVVRIEKIDYGKPGSPKIKLNAIEDIFSLPADAYTVPGGTEWVDTSEPPAPMEFTEIITLPLYFAQQSLSAAELTAIQYPEVMTAVLAVQDSLDTMAYDLVDQEMTATGALSPRVIGTRTVVGRTTLVTPLAAEATTVVAGFPNIDGTIGPAPGVFMFAGTGGDRGMEIALITDADGSGFTIKRGVLDTVPRAWPVGTPVWFVNPNLNIVDETIRSAGETVSYQLLTRTSLGTLSLEDAPQISATLSERPYLPARPANVRVNGVGFGEVDATGQASVTVTWAERNALNEPTQILGWTDGSITPEEGQTTTITVLDVEGNVLSVTDGLLGTSYTLSTDSSKFGSVSRGRVRVTSKRDGLESLQGHEIQVIVKPEDKLRLSGDAGPGYLLLSGDAGPGRLLLGDN